MSRETWIAIVIISVVTIAVITKSNAGPATMTKREIPESEKMYAFNNDGTYGGPVRSYTDPKTLCRYLVGYHLGMTIRYTKSGKPDCPGVL